MAAMKVLILGDSHITWLDRFVRATRPGGTDGFVVDGNNCVVRCVARPGATMPLLRSSAVRRLVEAEAAQLVILHVGSNDLDLLPSQQPQAIGMGIFMFAKQLVGQGVRHVVISQVVRRACWRHSRFDDGTRVEDGTRRADDINTFFDAACSGPEPISFWRQQAPLECPENGASGGRSPHERPRKPSSFPQHARHHFHGDESHPVIRSDGRKWRHLCYTT